MKPNILDGYNLFHKGMIALANVEHNGIRIDEEYLDKTILECSAKMKELEQKIKADKIYKIWERRFGNKAKICGAQLSKILFGELGYKPTRFTDKLNPKADKEAFEDIDLPIVDYYLDLEELKKAKDTFLVGIKREVVHGFLHPNFNLNINVSFRSSSSDPNFQNFPVRNKKMAQLIRSCFYPRKGYRIGEIDFSGIEVRIAACYCKDPQLIKYIEDPTTDMHRDEAMKCFLLSQEELGSTDSGSPGKDVRYVAKNQFVFPQFYGSYHVDCAKAMWKSIQKLSLTTAKGISLYEHLKKKGIKTLGDCDPKKQPVHGTFEHLIKKEQDRFWDVGFRVYSQWKRKWWDDYQRTGEFPVYTGFICRGVHKRNEVLSYAIQGSAFHCLLWCLIELDKWLRKHKMKSRIIGQIHDSIVIDFYPKEMQDVLAKAKELMTDSLVKAWKWIIVPLDVEAEVAETDQSWFEKKKVKIA